jgi:phage repressor protein C with HTH and peptisase S24 domain
MYALPHIHGMNSPELLVKKNLEWLIGQGKTNPYELQRATGVPQPTIHRILTGESTDPRTKTLQPLADYFRVSVADLRDRDLTSPTGEARPVDSNATFRPAEVVGADDPRVVRVPKVRLRVAAGISGFETEPERFDGSTMTVSREWAERHGYDPKLLLWVQVSGRSMEKTLFDGDWALIYTGQTEPKDEKIFAINFDGEPVIKRLTRDAGQWWLSSDNPDPQFYRRQCNDRECIIIGQAVLKHSEAL